MKPTKPAEEIGIELKSLGTTKGSTDGAATSASPRDSFEIEEPRSERSAPFPSFSLIRPRS